MDNLTCSRHDIAEKMLRWSVWLMVLNVNLNNISVISWRSHLLVEIKCKALSCIF